MNQRVSVCARECIAGTMLVNAYICASHHTRTVKKENKRARRYTGSKGRNSLY